MSEKDPVIRNRESWLKTFVVVTVTLISVYKLATTPINIDLSQFDFSDFLALILSLFAIGMSVAFYFKASETSNRFYNNSYVFTKDISEILGRIEAGFGERLRHLDEGYSGLREHFGRSPLETKETEKKIEEEQEKYEKKLKEREAIIEDLASRAKLEKEEKIKLFNDLRKRTIELNETQKELKFLKHRARGIPYVRIPTSQLSVTLKNYISGKVIPSLGGANELTKMPHDSIIHRFSNIRFEYDNNFIEEMRERNLLDSNFKLTEAGARKIRNIARNEIIRRGQNESE